MSTRKILVGTASLAGMVFAGTLLSGSFGTIPWMVNRATGLVAFALLSVVVVAGLLMSTKTGARLIKRPRVFALHQFISLLTVGFIAAHGLALLFDGFIAMGPVQVLVPFATSYQRFWTGMGVTAAWITSIVWASWFVRTQISPRRWRQLHYLSFISYFMALGHGVFGGTDTGEPLVAALYIVSISSVAAFVFYRIRECPARRDAFLRHRDRGSGDCSLHHRSRFGGTALSSESLNRTPAGENEARTPSPGVLA